MNYENGVIGDSMFNPVFGKELQCGIMTSNSVTAMLGSKAYSTEGMRLVMSKNTYSMGKDFTRGGTSIFKDEVAAAMANEFLGLGSGTARDGQLTDGSMITPETVKVPYKELPMKWNYGLGLMALESHGDDTGSHQQYMDLMSQFYADEIDKAILKPVTAPQARTNWFKNAAVGDTGREMGLTPLSRIIASGEEIGKTYGGTTVKPAMVLPWGGRDSDLKKRLQGLTVSFDSDELGEVSSGTAQRNNYDAQIVDAEGASLNLGMLNTLHTRCMQNRIGLKNNKTFFIMGPMMWNKLNMLCLSQRVYQTAPQMYATIGVGGMETVTGTDGGIQFNSYLNQPILVSPNIAYDYAAEAPSTTTFGDIYDVEGESIWMSLLTPMDMWSFKNPVVTGDLEEKYLLHMREELRCNKFNGSGRLVNVANA